jgi:co-chaperonin GroES (HSP10)
MRVDLRKIAQESEDDPKQAIYNALGDDWKGIEIFHNLVLVATYIPPEKTKGGIILTDRSIQENRFQGKAALVLTKGPLAFKDDSVAKFGGKDVEEGEWVFIRPSDGTEMYLGGPQSGNGVSVRLVEDTLIKGRVPDPSMIY